MLRVIGNSHAGIFSGKQQNWATWPEKCIDRIVNVKSFQLGPVIAYNFYEHHLPKVYDIINADPPLKHEWYLFTIGEVDCRWHIPYQADKQKVKFETIVEECVDRYFKAILELKQKKYNVAIWGVHPSTSSGHNNDPDNPVFGDFLLRNSISEYWNLYIAYLCKFYKIPYISIFYDLLNEDGSRKEEYYMDYCHLSESSLPLIKERINRCIPNLNI
jgi:hypothetical protein